MGKKKKKKEAKPEKKKSDAVELPIKFGAQGAQPDSTEPGSQAGKPKRKRLQEVLNGQASDREMEEARRKLLREAWTERDLLYRRIFGKPAHVSPANYGPPSLEVPADFELTAAAWQHSADTANPGDPTLEEQHLAVLAYEPDPQRPYWTYVTAGLASPWLQTEWQQVSGFGCELLVKSRVDNPWAPQLLRTLAFYVFNHAGLMSPGVRVGLNGSVDPNSSSLIRNAFIWYADEAPDAWYQLPSGGFGIFAIVGITEAECQFAESVEEYGTWCIQQVLSHLGHGQVTDPDRVCTMEGVGIDPLLLQVKNMADIFRQNAGAQLDPDLDALS